MLVSKKHQPKGISLPFYESMSGRRFLLAFARLGGIASEAMMKETQRPPDHIDQEIVAADALELARLLPPGPERNAALKRASLLRCTVDSHGPVFAKRGRPRK